MTSNAAFNFLTSVVTMIIVAAVLLADLLGMIAQAPR